jgi:hypothetical protein
MNVSNKDSLEKKTLTQLENIDWGEAKTDSYIAKAAHALRYKPIGEMTVEDMRLLIGQDVGLLYLMPRAVEILRLDPLAEGMHYPGDLLCAVLRANREYFQDNPQCRRELMKVLDDASVAIDASDDPGKDMVKEAIDEALLQFRQ